ncbi:MAG: hypothetical protein ABIA63_10250 [bacterium]
MGKELIPMGVDLKSLLPRLIIQGEKNLKSLFQCAKEDIVARIALPFDYCHNYYKIESRLLVNNLYVVYIENMYEIIWHYIIFIYKYAYSTTLNQIEAFNIANKIVERTYESNGGFRGAFKLCKIGAEGGIFGVLYRINTELKEKAIRGLIEFIIDINVPKTNLNLIRKLLTELITRFAEYIPEYWDDMSVDFLVPDYKRYLVEFIFETKRQYTKFSTF